jgi:hypothetical protein
VSHDLEAERARPARRRRGRVIWATIALPLIALLVVIGIPLASPLFPAETIVSCTIEKTALRERRAITPKQFSDCGAFISRKTVECTNDTGRDLALIPGITYDLVVRGPRLAPVALPVIESATVSAAQKHPPAAAEADDTPSDLPALQELEQRFSPEGLRAFDYEQPPYDPLCQVSRSIMTTMGVQLVDPVRAEQLLTPPEGLVPRHPKLPCEGVQCRAPLEG